MNNIKKKYKITIENQRIKIFKGVLLKCGNKERIFKYIMNLYKYLKIPGNTKGIPNALKKKPTKILEAALEQSSPIFTYKRIVKSGKLYEIPVPISMNRATFMASTWIRKVAQKKTTEGNSTHHFIGQEVVNILKKKGGVLEQLHTYTAEGLEKNIFKKLIKKKFPTISRSKQINPYRAILSRINKLARKQKFAGKGKQSTYFIMRIKKKHDGRSYRNRKQLAQKEKNRNKYLKSVKHVQKKHIPYKPNKLNIPKAKVKRKFKKIPTSLLKKLKISKKKKFKTK